MVHLSIVMVNLNMVSIIRTITLLRVTRNNLTIENRILANLNMVSIIRTITLLRVTRNNLTIENRILANLNKVNTLTLTSPSMLLTEELSLSVASILSPSMTLIVGLLSLSMASTLSPSMTLTEVASLNKINILLPAILSRHTDNQSIGHLPRIRRVLIQPLQTTSRSMFQILALLIKMRNRKISTPVESLAVLQMRKDPMAHTQISSKIIRYQVDIKMKAMTIQVFMKICLVPILWRKFSQNMQEKSNLSFGIKYFILKKK